MEKAPLNQLFEPVPLPRARAVITIVFVAAALLSAAGVLEFASGSPSAAGTTAPGYWTLFFGVHLVAFGGAAMLGGFPRIARPPVKIVYLAVVTAMYAAAFTVWRHHQTDGGGLGPWLARSPAYAPAAIALVIGLLWGPTAVVEEEPG